MIETFEKLNEYFNSFGLPAFLKGTEFIEIRNHVNYELNIIGDELNQKCLIQMNIYFFDSNPRNLIEFVDELKNDIAKCKALNCSNGNLYIYKSNPFAQFSSEKENTIQRCYVLLEMEINKN